MSILSTGQVVNFSGEAEIYGQGALSNGLITEYKNSGVLCIIQNTGTSIVTVCPGYTSGRTVIPFAGIVLNPDVSIVLDMKANSSIINTIRAVSHSGAGRVSLMVL